MLFQAFVYENQRMNEDNNSNKNKEENDGRYHYCE